MTSLTRRALASCAEEEQEEEEEEDEDPPLSSNLPPLSHLSSNLPLLTPSLEEEEEKVRRKELKVKLVKEEAETPMEVIASLWVGGIATLTLLSLVVLQVSGLLFKCSKSQICKNKFYILGVKDIPLVQRKKEHWSKHSSLAGPSVVSQLFTSRL